LSLKLGVEDPEQWLEDCPDRVYEQWLAAYRLRPFGDEQELLTKIVSLLILVASKDIGIEAVMNASNAIMQTLMTSEWVGIKEVESKKNVDSIKTFEDVVSRMFS
tara:strand:+ start:6358 stop:6672 length:315 start_codon:yes stop_codon:yes gene_type:complete